jgi:hypothetical protein
VTHTLRRGIGEANRIADETLRQTRAAMNMGYGIDAT